MTRRLVPPIDRLAERVDPVLGATEYVTLPVPVPLWVDTVSQLALLNAVHPQPAPDVTETLDVPPLAAIVALVGLSA